MNSSNPLAERDHQAVELAAQSLGMQLVPVDARNAGELDTALRAIHRSKVEGFLVSGDLFLFANRTQIARTIRRAKLPAIFAYREYHDAGVLMSYGISVKEPMHRVAVYVDKILRGAKAGDLPIEQIAKYQLVLNLLVARELGLEVPRTLRLRADEVIQ